MDDPLTLDDAAKVHSNFTEAREKKNKHSQEEDQLYRVFGESQDEANLAEALRSDEVNLPALAKEIEGQIEEKIISVNQVGMLERYI